MKKVKDIMSKPVITVKRNSTLKDAALKMRKKNIGSLVVAENKNPVGLVSERDFVRKSAAEGTDPKAVLAEDIMAEKPLKIDAGESVLKACDLLSRNNTKTLVVTNKDKMVGVVSMSNIIRGLIL